VGVCTPHRANEGAFAADDKTLDGVVGNLEVTGGAIKRPLRSVRGIRRLSVTKAVLFGSLASGTIGETSDLDLLLIAPSRERFTRRLEHFYRALAPSVALDLFVYTPEEFSVMALTNPFVRAAVSLGKVVL